MGDNDLKRFLQKWLWKRREKETTNDLPGRLLRKLAPKRTRFAAVDIGTREIKMVEISATGGKTEVTAFCRVPAPVGELGEAVYEEALVNALCDMVLSSGIQTKEVITTIGGNKTITRHIHVPALPDRELEAAVRLEAEKFIPAAVGELTIRYLKLGETNRAGERYLHLLLVAAPTTVVYDYYGVFTRAGLIIAAIDLEAFSLWRVFGGLETSTAILDIGASKTQLLVVRDGVLQFTRTIPAGGDLLTRSLAEHYGLTFQEAQRVKEEEGELLGKEDATISSTAAMQVDFSLRYGLSGLIREIRRSLDFYATQYNAAAIERFIISGGTSKLKGFREFFAEAMETPVDSGAPGIYGLPEYREEAVSYDPTCAVVLGTALREVAG